MIHLGCCASRQSRVLVILTLALGLIVGAAGQCGENSQPDEPKVAIIIDDLGNQRGRGLKVLALPGPVAMAFLPHTPFAEELAIRAHDSGKEVLLHLPMQAVQVERSPGPGAVTLDHTRHQFARIIAESLESVPHVSGVNNHMGSLLTRHPGHMAWLMEELKRREEFFFIDSYTTHLSVALQVARELNVPAMKRDVFLDRVVTDAALAREMERLKTLAREQGFAIGIGHPYRETLDFLSRELPLLQERGFRLVPVKALLPYRARQKTLTWRAYSSP